ncbi:DUF4336 domain-containing protein [Photobacterium sp. CCB-ST2H9]|uniref:DUF4336 domain-containing protein n=1 Tax=unclassified Photobacterium TaxID=2628852 RepID=UPI002004B118|nr:DUF4336 domain-containing protein [Photobacterium sp. CCB-ST2H9]UTM58493.1 DUF4336 domain-containing protein [Photobacterium sp. CCB-ST2H9]
MYALNESVWIADGKAVPFFTLPYTTRMTVVVLPDGKLWIHSPIELTPQLIQRVSELGEVAYLIAPNHLHHLFIEQWQQAFPGALTYGTDEVIKKRQDLVFHASLKTEQMYPWQPEIQHLLFTGSKAMQECVFFHQASRTLILTDLIENFPSDAFKPWQRLIAKGAGVMAPHGKTPLDWRLSFAFSKAEARQHLEQMLRWEPEVIVLSHGEMITSEATDFLRRSFSWLKPVQ